MIVPTLIYVMRCSESAQCRNDRPWHAVGFVVCTHQMHKSLQNCETLLYKYLTFITPFAQSALVWCKCLAQLWKLGRKREYILLKCLKRLYFKDYEMKTVMLQNNNFQGEWSCSHWCTSSILCERHFLTTCAKNQW